MTLNSALSSGASPAPAPQAPRWPPPRPACECGCYTRTPRYPSDLTDAQWAVLEPMLPPPAHTRPSGGRPETHYRRAVIDAIVYVIDNGTKWRSLPADFPPWRTIYGYFARWSADLTSHDLLHHVRAAARTATGRAPQPTAGCTDSQSVAETAEGTVPRATSGYDPHKRVNGRKRHIVTDTLGFLITVVVTPASTQDRDAAFTTLPDAATHGITHIWADTAYLSNALAAELHDNHGLTIEIVRRAPTQNGFQPLPRRWIIERTFAWITRRRRCARDYERLTDHHETAVHWAAIIQMTRHITRYHKPPQPD